MVSAGKRNETGKKFSVIILMAALGAAGCAGRVSLLPDPDPALRKTPAQFSADAAKRTFPATNPVAGEAVGRAQVSYDGDTIEVVNLSDEDWNDVEIWLNRDYVLYVPTIASGSQQLRKFNFRMFYDRQGNSFPTSKAYVTQLELVRNGKVYTLPFRAAD